MVPDLICKAKDTDTGIRDQSDSEFKQAHGPVICCSSCMAMVTKPEFAMHTGDGFSRTFANPAGHVFEIGCFSKAPGCATVSAPFDDFSWFPGFAWCMGACRNCAVQLGWVFLPAREEQGHRFYGLILDQLIFP